MLTLSEILELNCFERAEILSGNNYLDCGVQFVNVMEVPDILSWASENELILTTAYPFKDNPLALVHVIRQFSKKGIAALAIKTERFLKVLPNEVLDCARELNFPIISLPIEVQFDKMIFEILSHIIQKDESATKKSYSLSKKLQSIVYEGGTLAEISQALANWCIGDVYILNPDKQILSKYMYPKKKLKYPEIKNASYEKQIIFQGKFYATLRIDLYKDDNVNIDLAQIDAAIPSVIMLLFHTLIHTNVRQNEELLQDLILGRVAYTQNYKEQMQSIGIDTNCNYLVCVLRFGHRHSRHEQEFKNIMNNVMREFEQDDIPWPICTKAQGFDVQIFRRSQSHTLSLFEKFYASICEKTIEFDEHFYVGIGVFRSEPCQISEGYQEAVNALNFGLRTATGKKIFCYDDLLCDILLSKLTADSDSVRFVNSALSPLLQYDLHESKILIETLECLLIMSSDKAAAKALFVHPKTIAYRKTKISNLLNCDLNDKDTRFRLSFALKLYYLQGK